MRLDDPNLRPGETEEQRRQRLVKAAKWNRIAVEARGAAIQSSLTSRVLRLVFLVICGLALTGVGIYNYSDPDETSKTVGFGNQHFGPHGNAICETIIGLAILALAVHFLRQYIRKVRDINAQAKPKV